MDLSNSLRLVGLEYVAVDGSLPTPCPRGKDKFVEVSEYAFDFITLEDWDWDGSSTNQAEGHDSDKILRPVRSYNNPFESDGRLILCEVMNFDSSPHTSNSRRHLGDAVQKLIGKDIWMAVEQEYFIIQRQSGAPVDLNVEGALVGFDSNEEAAKAQMRQYQQGGDYCSTTNIVNEIMRLHRMLCHAAGIFVCGTNAEVAPAQGEFQILARNPLKFADDLTVARYLLLKLCAVNGVTLSLRPKLCDSLNGSGAHVNFSDDSMRNSKEGLNYVYQAREKLETNYKEVIKVCGAYNEFRLTGDHETAKIGLFNRGKGKSDRGVGDRGASVRIPRSTYQNGHGRCELRSPAANMDPYKVATAILEAVWGDGFNAKSHGWIHPDYEYI